MDPLSGLAIAGTLILTKAFEKQGERLGEAVWKKAENVMGLLTKKAPETAVAIAQVVQTPELAVQQPAQYGQGELSKQIEELVVRDVEVRAALESLVQEASPQMPLTIENWQGINIKGGSNTVQGITQNFN